MEPLISVIVPIYNVEPYLRPCVDSILDQTYTNLEVILVDDGSPDGCGAICDEYAQKDSRVRVIHKKNGGLSDARNSGMAICRGDYLSFVDSDDLLPGDALEILERIAAEENADLVIGSHDRFEDEPEITAQKETERKRWTPAEAMADMLRNGCASWARLYRRELHLPVQFPVGEINEDEAIVLELLDRCERVVKTDAVVYHYRCRPESITTASFSEKKLDWYRHCRKNHDWIKQHQPDLEHFALDRLGSSVVFLLHQMALADYRDQRITDLLLDDLKKNYRVYQKHYLSGPKEKFRMWFFRYMPYGCYRLLMRIKRSAV